MSPFLFVALSLTATPQVSSSGPSYIIEAAGGATESPAATESANAVDAPAKDARTPAAWRSEIRATLRRESSTKGGEREAAVRKLLKLYRLLGQPTNLVDTEQRQLRAQLRSRLQRTSETLASQARRQSAQEKAGGKARPGKQEEPIARIDVSVEVLAQQLGQVSLGQAPALQIIPLGGVNLVGPDQSGALAELIRTTISLDSWDPNRGGSILAQQIGMPGQAGGFGGGGRGGGGGQAGQRQNADAGPELVELIQQTIAPDSWDVNGGPGTIFYFSPLRVLVIRQTDEVHDGLGGLIQGLRN